MRTARLYTMAKVALDANVIIGWLDEGDSLNARSVELMNRIHDEGNSSTLLDFTVGEAVSVICRRTAERKRNVPDLPSILDTVDEWFEQKEIEFVQKELEVLYPHVLKIIRQSGGALNFNDAALVALQRKGIIGEVATFDATLASHPGFQTIG